MLRKTCFALVFVLLAGIPVSGICLETPKGMFELYEQNRTQGIPNYITEDFILLSYAMILNETVTEIEEGTLYPEFTAFISDLTKKFESEKEPDEIVKANLAYLNVLACLLSETDKTQTRPCLRAGNLDNEAILRELTLIKDAMGISPSALMKQQIDYSQFKVRGKYTRNETLGRYFRAMKYAGTVLFPVSESNATGITPEQADLLTGQAMSLIRTIHNDESLLNRLKKLDKPLSWLFGPPDDLISEDYISVADKMKDKPMPEIRKALLEQARKNGRQPLILSGLVNQDALEEGVSAKDVLTGWRFIPSRFTPDSAAFQQLVYDQVKSYKGKKDPFSKALINKQVVKGFPLGLELMALLGSREAGKRLDASDERNYEGYQEAAKQAKNLLTPSEESMASKHLSIIKYWLTRERTPVGSSEQDSGGSEPGKAESRCLNTCLGFWTYTRYITLAYAKQSYTTSGKGLAPAFPRRINACLEPADKLYVYLQEQMKRLNSMMETRDQKSRMKESVKEFMDILDKLRDISLREKDEEQLKEKDITFLNNLDKRLLKLTRSKDQAIVTDVHTEPNTQKVLEEGIGYPQVVEKGIRYKVTPKARGALFTHYEFKYPMNDRLTDEAWRGILRDEEKMKRLEMK